MNEIWKSSKNCLLPPIWTLVGSVKMTSSKGHGKKKIDNSIDFLSHADETKFSVFRLRNV